MSDSSKYNFDLGDTPTGTHKLILDYVPEYSTVLECGCASGYMTKYMNQKLNCNVDIVEIDKECLEKAKQYSRFNYCGDLEGENWDHSVSKDYDRILFADVLEHLRDPLMVVKRAAALLDPYDGQIVVSIPNICHNDIIIKMFYNRFDYTPLGLLDNTHIHFWGINNLEKFFDEAGLKITKIIPVVIPTGHTEQRIAGVNKQLLDLLDQRLCGDAYQYVIVCKKDV